MGRVEPRTGHLQDPGIVGTCHGEWRLGHDNHRCVYPVLEVLRCPPRVHHVLHQDGHRVGRTRVSRLMRPAGIRARRRCRFARTTDSMDAWPIAENALVQDFAVGGRVKTVWVSDNTFVPIGAVWLYNSVVIDLASRFVLGRATSARNESPWSWRHSFRSPPYGAPCPAPAITRTGATPTRVSNIARRFLPMA
jgi:transposase InsO family protein